jgi:ATP synthase protein I
VHLSTAPKVNNRKTGKQNLAGLTLNLPSNYNLGLFLSPSSLKAGLKMGSSSMDRRIRRVLGVQLVWLLTGALIASRLWGSPVGWAAGFGAFIAVANTALIARHMRPRNRSIECGELSAQHYLRQFYRSCLLRYLVVGVLLASGLGGLKLMPLALLGGFILGQLIWIIAPLTIKET